MKETTTKREKKKEIPMKRGYNNNAHIHLHIYNHFRNEYVLLLLLLLLFLNVCNHSLSFSLFSLCSLTIAIIFYINVGVFMLSNRKFYLFCYFFCFRQQKKKLFIYKDHIYFFLPLFSC